MSTSVKICAKAYWMQDNSGLMVNADVQVIDAEGAPIQDLYIAKEILGAAAISEKVRMRSAVE